MNTLADYFRNIKNFTITIIIIISSNSLIISFPIDQPLIPSSVISVVIIIVIVAVVILILTTYIIGIISIITIIVMLDIPPTCNTISTVLQSHTPGVIL